MYTLGSLWAQAKARIQLRLPACLAPFPACPASIAVSITRPSNEQHPVQFTFQIMSNFLVEVCPMKYLGHSCIEVICWLSEIKIEGGILY